MREWTVNLFMLVDTKIIPGVPVVKKIGALWTKQGGTDSEKLAYLQDKVQTEFRRAIYRPLPDWCMVVDGEGKVFKNMLTLSTFNAFKGTLRFMGILEEIAFKHFKNAPPNPLLFITPIRDGKVWIETVVDVNTQEPHGQE